MRSVAGPDVVGPVGRKPAGRREHAVRGPDVDAIAGPAQDEWLKVEIGEPSACAQLPGAVGRQRVIRHQQRRRGREPRAAEECLSADPDECVQVDHHGVVARLDDFTSCVLRFIASVEDEQVRVRQARSRDDAGIDRAHPGRIDASDLCCCNTAPRQCHDNHHPRTATTTTHTEAPSHPLQTHGAAAARTRTAGCCLPASRRASGINTANETIMTTVIITTTLASVKFWPATTSAAAVLRWAVPSESTPRVAAPGPPSTQPMPKQTATKISAATMPSDPRMLTMLPRCPAVVSTTTKIMLMLDTGATNARTRPALGGCHALNARPTASGISISRIRDRAMLAGFTDTPGSSSGRTIGMWPTAMTISTTISPTANGMSAFARSASLRRNGAPPATATSNSPIASGSSRPSTLASPMAATGANTKFASRDSATSRPLRNGATICGTVSPRPTDSVLETTKTTTDALAPRINISVSGMAFARYAPSKTKAVDSRAAAGLVQSFNVDAFDMWLRVVT